MNDIKNTTKITKKMYLHYYGFTIRKSFRIMFSYVFLFCFLVVMLFALSSLDKTHSSINKIVMIIIAAIILAVLMTGLFYITPLRAYKKIKDFTCEYMFGADGIEAKSSRPEVNTNANYHYNAIVKAYEFRDAFYLYIDKRQAILVNKNGFTQGNAEELRAVLKEKIGIKFRVPRYLRQK